MRFSLVLALVRIDVHFAVSCPGDASVRHNGVIPKAVGAFGGCFGDYASVPTEIGCAPEDFRLQVKDVTYCTAPGW